MLRNKLIEQIKQYINNNRKTILKELNLTDDFEVKFLAQGEYNINFTIESFPNKYVFRVNTGSQLQIDNQIGYEFNSLKYLESSSVTPRVFFVDSSKLFFDYGILIMEFLEGVPLDYGKDLNKAAKIFSKIHSLEIRPDNHFIIEKNIFSARINEGERLLANIWDSTIVDKKIKSFFYQFLDWAKINKDKEKYFIDNPWYVINNTEVNSHNFIIGEKNSYLIDWEKPVISDPAQDLTQFLSPTTTLWKTNYILSNGEKEEFFRNYINGLKGEDKDIRDRVQLYTPYLYLRALGWCAYAYVEYHDPKKEIKNRDTFEKIKEYLNIDFMEKLLKPYNIIRLNNSYY
ncbi:phosphotransferase [Tissierella praeacuta]|uniref:phosphotransferase n=1 Tax=Tissierella praeacuta TaxID=43131 RepID=UPI003DA52C88